MRTHIELDDSSLEDVLKYGGFSNRTAAVNAALGEFAKLLKRRELLELRGKVTWNADLDVLRRDRSQSSRARSTA
jgi:Arc/MetJ family transcription regulator